MAETFEVLSIDDLMAMDFPSTRGIEEALKAYAATGFDKTPRYKSYDTPPAHFSLPVHWMGRQWAVTDYGLECRTHHYVIEKNRLWEREKEHGWVRQIFHKTWANPTDFAEALRIARHVHVQD